MSGEPYCSNCGYKLIGLTDSSKCPECGKPIVDVFMRTTMPLPRGRRYVSPIRIFGLPLVHVAMGPYEKERIGRARGIIAVGDIAVGFVAIGGLLSCGVVSIGGALAVGVAALSGCAIGLLAIAGLAVGGVALGGCSVGGIAVGGLSVGIVADGGMAIGKIARGGATYGPHAIRFGSKDPQAVAVFKDLEWLLGAGPGASMITIGAWIAVALLGIGLLTALIVWLGWLATGRRTDEP